MDRHKPGFMGAFIVETAQDGVQIGKEMPPFDIATDYRLYVDGKPRLDGVSGFVSPRYEAFRREMKAAGADFRIISYPGALHAFTNPEADSYAKQFNMPIAYNADADKKSWAEMKAFFKDIFRD